MKTLIFYTSKTGFTKQYAEMLERRLIDAELHPLKDLSNKLIESADIIFYGGPIRNNSILGLKKFLKKYNKMKDKDVFIFGVGMEQNDDDRKANIIMANSLDSYHVRLYLLPGGVDISKLNWFARTLITRGLKSQAKKQNLDEELINQRLSNPISMVESSNLDRMVQVYHAVKIKRGTSN